MSARKLTTLRLSQASLDRLQARAHAHSITRAEVIREQLAAGEPHVDARLEKRTAEKVREAQAP